MKSPEWIDEYTLSVHRAFTLMSPSHWSSVNGFKIIAALQGSFILRLNEALMALQQKGITPKELWELLSNPSTLRSATWKILEEYAKTEHKELIQDATRNVLDTIDAVLRYGMLEDKWALDKNVVHRPDEVNALLTQTPWIVEDTPAVRSAARLYVSSASIAFALYRDFFPEDAHEVYGPYDASERFGEGTQLIVKHFSKMRPVALWPEVAGFPYEEIKIYQVLKGVHFSCNWIGMHSLYDGPVVPNTVAIAVEADGRFLSAVDIATAAETIGTFVLEYSPLYEKLTIPEAKDKFLEWLSYCFVGWFEKAGMDWHPTESMLAPVRAAEIEAGFGTDSFPSYEEYLTNPEFEVYWLKKLYE